LIDLREPLCDQAASIQYPAVIKPLALSASRGVIRVDDAGEFISACERVEKMLACEPHLDEHLRQHLLVEQFIRGGEVAVEGMLYNGKLQLLALFDKPDPLDGPFFEETYYISPGRISAEQQAELYRVIQATCDAYGLREGPVHGECRLNEQGVWVLEVAARTIGGLCGRLLQFGTGMSLERLVLLHAMSQAPEIEHQPGGAGVLMIPIPRGGVFKRVEGLLKAQRVPYIEEISIQIREGYEVTPLPEGASYLGFIFARAPDADLAEQALREAHACLNIVIDPLIQVNVA
jgi:biotin carboxylase